MSILQRQVGMCVLPERLAIEMAIEADTRAPLETGGVILGVSDEDNVWIDTIIGPGPTAVHSRHSFSPDSNYQERQIACAYEESGRRLTYLGDWHTHPGSSPALSWRDRRTLRDISGSDTARQPRPVMLIWGYGNPWRVAAWRYHPSGWWLVPARLSALNVVLQTEDER